MNPTPLVLLPGVMCDAGLWQRMLPELEQLGPLIYGDLSQGRSITEMADAVLAACPPRFTLVGFSMGGYVAREILRRVPQRVQSLVLIATSSAADSEAMAEFKQAVAENLQRASGTFHGIGQRAIAQSLSRDHQSDPQLQQAILDMSVRLGRETFIRQLRMPRSSDTDLLSAIRCPTLVIAAADDRMRTLEESRQLAAAIPASRLEVVENSGHMLPLEQPCALLMLLRDWLGNAA